MKIETILTPAELPALAQCDLLATACVVFDALRGCVGAKIILASSFLNLGATAEFLRQNNFENILLVCAGTGENQADEDVLAAGALCELLVDAPGPINPVAADVRPLHLKSVE